MKLVVGLPERFELGELCRLARQARGMGIEALGRRVGRSGAWVSRIEKGQIRLTPVRMDRILRALGARLEPPRAVDVDGERRE